MIDREKVVRAVETCFDSWIDKHRDKGLDWHEVERMKHDALELLKAQEQLLIKRDTVDEIYGYIAECPNCGIHFSAWEEEKIRFCPGCGRKVKWE